tara:strand:+ start:148 stop:945 length:798 start_codon:yes stop_codon:yes gene_type:complete
MKNNKVVYIHRKKTDDTIFYIGIGNPNRAYHKDSAQRSVVWHRTVKKHGYKVEVILRDLQWEEACEIEIYLIKQFGRRDRNKGSLVNLTDGGEGGNGHISDLGKSVYNIETGELFSTIGKGAESIGMPQGTVGDQLRNYRGINIQDKNILRMFNDPYPENDSFWSEVRNNEISFESDEFKNINNDSSIYYEDTEFDDDETEILDRIYNEPEDNIDAIYLSYTKSIRKVAEEMEINYGKIVRMLNDSKENVLRDRISEYKNAKNKR